MNKVHVFYTDKSNGWAVVALDHNNFQVGEARYNYRKADAMEDAKSDGVPVHVYGKNGLYQRTHSASAAIAPKEE